MRDNTMTGGHARPRPAGGRTAAVAVRTIIATTTVALALGACTRSSNLNQGGLLPERQAKAPPLQPAPVSPVREGALQPAGPTPPPPPDRAATAPPSVVEPPAAPRVEVGVPDAAQAPAQEPVQTASAGGEPVTKEALVGAWTVSAGGKSCQIFLALTKWSGGFRAAQRGCAGTPIGDVQAWNVSGRQVVLVDGSGTTAATLFKSGAERYDGSARAGGSVSFTR